MESSNDDDDFDIKPRKIPKITYDDLKNEAETCVICLELFTVTGDHKLVSLKCGHVFGQKCINSWLSHKNYVCPNCKTQALQKDIRPVYIDIPSLKIEDNTELIKTTEDLNNVKVKLKETEMECSRLRAQCNSFMTENNKLRGEVEILKQKRILLEHQFNKTENNTVSVNNSRFSAHNKLLISTEGDCRVMAYAQAVNALCISAPSPNPLYHGFCIRLVGLKPLKLMKILPLHSKMIRDIAFSPIKSNELMLTGSLDKSVKLTNLKTEKIVSSYVCSMPVWSCAWSCNEYVFYAGLSNGTIEELDTRNLTSPVATVWSQAGSPVLAMKYVLHNQHLSSKGLIVTNSQNVIFLDKAILVPDSEQSNLSNSASLMSTLVVASNHGGKLIHSTFNDRTSHLLSTFRPELGNKSQFLLSQMGTTQVNDADMIYASDTKSFPGGTTKEYMARSCFIDDGVSANYVVCPDEESSSIKVWNSNCDGDSVSLYPHEVTRNKPILDVCQLPSDEGHVSFAALNCHNLYLYVR